MPNKKDSNWNTEKFRKWELTNLGISVNPDYTGKDILDFKQGGQHLHTKFKIRNLNR